MNKPNAILNFERPGSWFTLEPWIVQAPYRSASGIRASDLDVAKGKNAQDIIEDHWENFITSDDWEWLVERGINTVRLPVRTPLARDG